MSIKQGDNAMQIEETAAYREYEMKCEYYAWLEAQEKKQEVK